MKNLDDNNLLGIAGDDTRSAKSIKDIVDCMMYFFFIVLIFALVLYLISKIIIY